MKKNNKIQSILIFLVALGVSADYTIAQGVAQGNLVAGAYHTAVILDDGSVKTWGSNSHGQLGQGIAVVQTLKVMKPVRWGMTLRR